MPSKDRRWIYVVTRVADDFGPTTIAVTHTTADAEKAFADAVENYSARGYVVSKGKRGVWTKNGDVLFGCKVELHVVGGKKLTRYLRLEKWQYGA